jgi:hypothetical protein
MITPRRARDENHAAAAGIRALSEKKEVFPASSRSGMQKKSAKQLFVFEHPQPIAGHTRCGWAVAAHSQLIDRTTALRLRRRVSARDDRAIIVTVSALACTEFALPAAGARGGATAERLLYHLQPRSE